MLSEALHDVRSALSAVFRERVLHIALSWDISGRAVSEIGGRLIEDFVLRHIAASFREIAAQRGRSIQVAIPVTGRAMEDFSVHWTGNGSSHTLLIDIKGHNQYRRGSRPNLASIRKTIDLYSAVERIDHELVIFFCRYRPSVLPEEFSRDLVFEVLPESFGEAGVFPLRFLAESNLDPANIGSGGQLLLAREDRIALQERSREEFVGLLRRLQVRATNRPTTEISDGNAAES